MWDAYAVMAFCGQAIDLGQRKLQSVTCMVRVEITLGNDHNIQKKSQLPSELLKIAELTQLIAYSLCIQIKCIHSQKLLS